MANNYAMQAALQKFYYITGEMEKLQTDLEGLIAEHGVSHETIEGKIIFGLLSEVARIQISARKLTINTEDFSGAPAELSSVEVTGPCGGGQKLEIVSTANTAAHGSIFD